MEAKAGTLDYKNPFLCLLDRYTELHRQSRPRKKNNKENTFQSHVPGSDLCTSKHKANPRHPSNQI